MKNERLSSVLEVPLEAVSSSGLSASFGIQAVLRRAERRPGEAGQAGEHEDGPRPVSR